jgi:hypothetical protein
MVGFLIKISCLLMLLMIFPSVALACRCAGPTSPSAAYKRAHVVVVGKVAKIVSKSETDSTATIIVSQVWKENMAHEITVSTSTTCAFDFVVGDNYILYLYKAPDGGYYTSRCVGNSLFSKGTNIITWLKRNARASQLE